MVSGAEVKLALKKLVTKVEPPVTVPVPDMALAVVITVELSETAARRRRVGGGLQLGLDHRR